MSWRIKCFMFLSFAAPDGHHPRSGWSFRFHYRGRLPPAGRGLLTLLSSWSRWSESWRLCHGGQWHPCAAAWDCCSADQSLSREDAPARSAVSGPQAETENQRRRQPDRRRTREAGSETQSSGIQQEGAFYCTPDRQTPGSFILWRDYKNVIFNVASFTDNSH